VGLQLLTELEPAGARHVDVEDYDVGPCRADAATRGVGAVGFVHVDVGDLERRPQQRPERWIVIDQQDSQAAGPPGFPYLNRSFGNCALSLEPCKEKTLRPGET